MGRCQDGALIKDVRTESVNPASAGFSFCARKNKSQGAGSCVVRQVLCGLFDPGGEGIDVLLQEGLDAVVQLAVFVEEIARTAQIGFRLLQ